MKNKKMDPGLQKLINLADEAYYEQGLIKGYSEGDECGDTLAEFIVHEMRSVYDPEKDLSDNVAEIKMALGRAIEDLDDVIYFLSTAG